MSNQDVGSIDCPICHQPASVRQYKQRSRLDTVKGGSVRYAGLKYIFCANGCGKITTSNQAFIENNAKLDNVPQPAGPEKPVPLRGDDPLAPPPGPVETSVTPAEPEKETGFLDGWL